ncbi:MAG: hypothetical protein J7J46_02025 [Candidatus Desulfofervidus sp.]|nr:hypothetical protein [Candidatus Desulfofervidus sp.]
MEWKLNVGCGMLHERGEEWVNIDRSPRCNPDVVLDITKGLPTKYPWGRDDSVSFIKAQCCLGQIERNDDFLFVMNEFWRVLRPGGELWVYLPHVDYPHAYVDPFNVRRFNELSLESFDYRHPQYVNHNSYYGFKPWVVLFVHTNKSGFLSARMQPKKQ